VATVGEATADIGVSKPTISRHLRMLEEAGVVSRVIDGRTHRPALRPETLAQAEEWIVTQRIRWGRLFDVVDEYLEERKQRGWPSIASASCGSSGPSTRRPRRSSRPGRARRCCGAGSTATRMGEAPTAGGGLRVGGRIRMVMRRPDSGLRTMPRLPGSRHRGTDGTVSPVCWRDLALVVVFGVELAVADAAQDRALSAPTCRR
jgi:hypothetical protein